MTDLGRFDPSTWVDEGLVVAPFPVRAIRRVLAPAFVVGATIVAALAAAPMAQSSAAITPSFGEEAGPIADPAGAIADVDLSDKPSDYVSAEEWAVVEKYISGLPKVRDAADDPDEEIDYSL